MVDLKVLLCAHCARVLSQGEGEGEGEGEREGEETEVSVTQGLRYNNLLCLRM